MRFIFVCDRGFVIVGKVVGEDSLTYTLEDCSVIRRWTTGGGLGLLAMKGPSAGCILDKEPDGTTLNKLFVMRRLPCNEKNWSKT